MIQDQIIREPELLKLCGFSKATRWRLEKEGKFPARRQISKRSVGWLLSEVHEWKASLGKAGETIHD